MSYGFHTFLFLPNVGCRALTSSLHTELLLHLSPHVSVSVDFTLHIALSHRGALRLLSRLCGILCCTAHLIQCTGMRISPW